jgi:hypothetical protein
MEVVKETDVLNEVRERGRCLALHDWRPNVRRANLRRQGTVNLDQFISVILS